MQFANAKHTRCNYVCMYVESSNKWLENALRPMRISEKVCRMGKTKGICRHLHLICMCHPSSVFPRPLNVPNCKWILVIFLLSPVAFLPPNHRPAPPPFPSPWKLKCAIGIQCSKRQMANEVRKTCVYLKVKPR